MGYFTSLILFLFSMLSVCSYGMTPSEQAVADRLKGDLLEFREYILTAHEMNKVQVKELLFEELRSKLLERESFVAALEENGSKPHVESLFENVNSRDENEVSSALNEISTVLNEVMAILEGRIHKNKGLRKFLDLPESVKENKKTVIPGLMGASFLLGGADLFFVSGLGATLTWILHEWNTIAMDEKSLVYKMAASDLLIMKTKLDFVLHRDKECLNLLAN